MIYTSEIIDRLISCINDDFGIPSLCMAVRGFEAVNLPIPIKTTYFSIVPEENKVTCFENDNLEYCQKTSVTIRMNCFSPLRRKASAIHAMAEAVLDFINDSYPDEIKGYTIGDTEYDDDIKAYRVTCRLFFEYEACAADSLRCVLVFVLHVCALPSYNVTLSGSSEGYRILSPKTPHLSLT